MTPEINQRKTHLIYLDENNKAWIQEHQIGSPHPDNAIFYAEILPYTSQKWSAFEPSCKEDEQYLALVPDIKATGNVNALIIDKNNTQKCYKHIPITSLEFIKMPKFFHSSIYHFGVFQSYRSPDSPPTEEFQILASSKDEAKMKAYQEHFPTKAFNYLKITKIEPNLKATEHNSKPRSPKF